MSVSKTSKMLQYINYREPSRLTPLQKFRMPISVRAACLFHAICRVDIFRGRIRASY